MPNNCFESENLPFRCAPGQAAAQAERYKIMKYILFILLTLTYNASYACTVPKPGYNWNKDDLIDKSKSIVLVKLNSIDTDNSSIKYTLSPIKVLKGKGDETVFWSHSTKHYDSDFNYHSDGEFWMPNIGRSEFPCCICGPDHTFKKGEMYLLFPDAMGAMKSGEIIKNIEKDEWYKYVIDRVNG